MGATRGWAIRGELATRAHDRHTARVAGGGRTSARVTRSRYVDAECGVERVMGARGARQQQQRRKLWKMTPREQILYCSSSSLATTCDIKSASRETPRDEED